MEANMKETYKKILKSIENDSRISIKDLATELGMKDNEVASSLTEMEEKKIICGYHTLINWDNTDEEIVTALIEVKASPQRGNGFDKIAERIMKFDEVTTIYLMSGGYDYCVIIEGKSMKEVSRFVFEKLSTLDCILSTSTHFVLKKYKDHGTILEEKKKGERMLLSA
jgi:DNA-binding Lrp family transcriptional regulator